MSAARPSPPAPTWHGRLPFFYGWVIVAITFMVGFFNSGQSWVTSVFVIPMQDELGWSRSAIYGASALRGVTALLSAPLVGGLADRANGARWLLVLSGLAGCLSVVASSTVQQEWQFLFWFGLVGGLSSVGQGFVLLGATVPKWFIRRRGSAIAWASLAGGASPFAMPVLMTAVIDGIGWRSAWLALGALVFLTTVVPAFLLHRQPEDIGLLPDGGPAPGAPAGTRPPVEVSLTLRAAMHTRTFWVLVVGIAAGSFSLGGLPASLVPIYVDRGFSTTDAAWALTLYGAFSMSARFFWGYWAGRLHIRTLLLCIAGYGAATAWTMIVLPGEVALIYAALAGFFVGGYVTYNQAAFAGYFGRAHVGSITGMARPLAILSSSAGPIALAAVHDTFGNYNLGFLMVTVSWVLCAAALLFARPVRSAATA